MLGFKMRQGKDRSSGDTGAPAGLDLSYAEAGLLVLAGTPSLPRDAVTLSVLLLQNKASNAASVYGVKGPHAWREPTDRSVSRWESAFMVHHRADPWRFRMPLDFRGGGNH
jgi:hypothetical protein